MKLYKLRGLVISNSRENIYGITIPSQIVERMGVQTRFSIEISGTSIILSSGCYHVPNKAEIDKFDLESIRV